MKTQSNDYEVDKLFQEESLDLRHYWRVVTNHKWKIAALSLAVGVVAALVLQLIPPRYQATATLLFDDEQINLLEIENIYSQNSEARHYNLTQIGILTSRKLAERVITKLDLLNHPEFNPEQGAKAFNLRSLIAFVDGDDAPMSAEMQEKMHLERVLEAFSRSLSVSEVRNTQLINVTFQAATAELAAQVANAVANEYISTRMDARIETTQRATSWLNERMLVLRTKLEESEQKLHAYKEEQGLVDISGVRGLATQEVSGINSQLAEALRQFNVLSDVYSQVRKAGDDMSALSALPRVQSDTIFQDLKRAHAEADRQLSELSVRYGPLHPKMIAATDKLDALEAQLNVEARRIRDAITKEYLTAQSNVDELEASLARSKNDYQMVSRKEDRYQNLVREVDVNRQLYNAFLTRLHEANETSDFESSNARIVDPAVPPRLPVESKKKAIVIAAVVLGALFGIFLALMFEFFNDCVRSVQDIENKLQQRLMGLLPFVKKRGKSTLGLRDYFDPDQFAFAESVRTLRTSVVLSHLEQPAKVIAITSSMPGEGKTSVAENLAFALSKLEKVLLIDADMRRPSIAKDFELPSYSPGLSNLLSGNGKISKCLVTDKETGLDVMPAGSESINPQELLTSERFAQLIGSCAKVYDRIIVDTPPVQMVSDALVVGRVADSCLFVVRAESTRLKVAGKALERLQQTGAHVDGVIMNMLDTSAKDAALASDGYYHDSKYGGGYDQPPQTSTNGTQSSAS